MGDAWRECPDHIYARKSGANAFRLDLSSCVERFHNFLLKMPSLSSRCISLNPTDFVSKKVLVAVPTNEFTLKIVRNSRRELQPTHNFAFVQIGN